jgi:hypothetical protein
VTAAGWAYARPGSPAAGPNSTATKEENHQDTLRQFAPRNGDAFREVVATLCFCTITSGKHQGKEAIEVQLGGHRVGQLTRLMTERYEHVLRDLLGRGLHVTCEGRTLNTPKGVQVEIRLPDPRRIGLRDEP